MATECSASAHAIVFTSFTMRYHANWVWSPKNPIPFPFHSGSAPGTCRFVPDKCMGWMKGNFLCMLANTRRMGYLRVSSWKCFSSSGSFHQSACHAKNSTNSLLDWMVLAVQQTLARADVV